MADEALRREDGLSGWRRYLYAADGRDIGTMFLVFAMLAMLVGAGLGAELAMAVPGVGDATDARGAAILAGAHGTVMLFFCLLPAFAGLTARLVLISIGAPNLAFPRLCNFAFWLMPLAALLFFLSFKVQGDAGGLGFAGVLSMDAALATIGAPGPAADFVVAALLLCLLSLGLMAVGLIVTILNYRAGAISLDSLSLAPWSVLIANFVLLTVLPVLAAALAMLWADRHFATVLFNPAGGGDVLLFRHLVWFGLNGIGWALAVSALGVAGEAIAAFAGKPGYARRRIAQLLVVLAVLGLLGWGRALAADGLSPPILLFYTLAGLAALIPALLAIVLMIASLWRGAIAVRAPLLWALGVLPVFTLAMLSGVMLDGPMAGVLRGTAFEAAHLHILFVLTPLFGLCAGWYRWFPKMFGHRPSESLAALHFMLTFVGASLAYARPVLLGLMDVPGADIDPGLIAQLRLPAEIGIGMMAAGALLWPGGLMLAHWQSRISVRVPSPAP